MKLLFRCQEVVRKDVERVFRVSQSQFAIVQGPTRFWEMDVIYTSIILHNIIVENGRDSYEILFDLDIDESPIDISPVKL